MPHSRSTSCHRTLQVMLRLAFTNTYIHAWRLVCRRRGPLTQTLRAVASCLPRTARLHRRLWLGLGPPGGTGSRRQKRENNRILVDTGRRHLFMCEVDNEGNV
eukprot:359236-Chlamydomonas_euryale.AAC.10